MTIDSVLRAIGALTCLYTIGLLVSVTSTAALNAVAHEPSVLCADVSCAPATVAQHHAAPGSSGMPQVIHTAALFFAGSIE